MLFPTDPEKRPELWSKFTEKMVSGQIEFLAHRGEVISSAYRLPVLTEGPHRLIGSFRLADVVRFGASGGQPLGPYFALALLAKTAYLVEYAIDHRTQSNEGAAMQEALQSIALNLFFKCRHIIRISLPLVLPGWELKEWKALAGESGTTLLRQANTEPAKVDEATKKPVGKT